MKTLTEKRKLQRFKICPANIAWNHAYRVRKSLTDTDEAITLKSQAFEVAKLSIDTEIGELKTGKALDMA